MNYFHNLLYFRKF